MLWRGDCEDYVHAKCVGVDPVEVERVFTPGSPAVFLCPPCRTYRAQLAANMEP